MNLDDLRYDVHMLDPGKLKDEALTALDLVESANVLARGKDYGRSMFWLSRLVERKAALEKILKRAK